MYHFFQNKGGGILSSDLINESFVSFNLQIGAEHIPVCLRFVHCKQRS